MSRMILFACVALLLFAGAHGVFAEESAVIDPNVEMYKLGILYKANLANVRVDESVEGVARTSTRLTRKGLKGVRAGDKLVLRNAGNNSWVIELPRTGAKIRSTLTGKGLVWKPYEKQ